MIRCVARLVLASFLVGLPSTGTGAESSSARTEGESESRAGGPAAADLRDRDVEEIVVYGIRPGRLAPIPGASTDVIFTDDYRAESKSLADLLSETEGVRIRRFGGAGDRSEISIRGSSPSQVVVAIDGVKANSVLTGGIDLSRVCLPLLERVEVTRGAGSLKLGSGAVGGVVNLVTRSADQGPETRAAFSAGAFETWEGSILHAGEVGRLDYSLGYCGFATEGDFEFARPTDRFGGVDASFVPDSATRINNDREQHGSTLGLGLPLAGGELRFTDFAVFSSGGEPGTDSDNTANAGQSAEARSRDFSNLAQLRWEGPSPTGWGEALELLAYHRFERTSFRDPQARFRPPIDLRARLMTQGLRVTDVWSPDALGTHHELELQADLAHDVLRATDQIGRERPRAAASLRDALRLFDDRLVLSAGARLDWVDGFDPQILPSAGLVIEPFPWIRIRGQAGRAYRVPNFDELFHPDQGFIRGNPDLSPEDAWNFDLGLELELARAGPFSRIHLRGSWFRREIDESIVWVLINSTTLAPVNVGEATIQGFEVSASIDLGRYLRLSANHTQIDSERASSGKRLPGQPEEETFARLRIGREEAWKIVGEVHRVGEQLVSEGGSRILPARTVWNASASLNWVEIPWAPSPDWARAIWLYVEVDNFTDEAVRDSLSFPQPGRQASAGLEVSW